MENENTNDFFGHTCSLIGSKLPNFEMNALINNDIKKISLSDYKGKWFVLFFYPANFTFVCPTELEEMAKHYSEFKKLNCEILAISTDTAFAHKAWKDMSPAISKVNYPMLSDASHCLSSYLNILIAEEGITLRGTFIVDPDGIIKSMEVNDNSIGRSAKELLRKLKAIQFVREHGDKVCPASWEEEGDALTPDISLVGKI